MSQVVYRRRTDYNDVEVTREGDVVTLWSEGVRQTAISTGSPLPLIESSRNMLLALAFSPRPRRALILGLGGGSVVRMLLAALPDLLIDAVEIDPAMAAVARQHFGLRPSGRLRLTLGDATDFAMERTGEGEYDLVLVDPYLGDRFATGLTADSVLDRLRGSLTPEGVLVMNLFSGQPRTTGPALRSLGRRFRSVFTLSGVESRNVLAFASKRTRSREEVISAALEVETGLPFSFDLARIARRMTDRQSRVGRL